MLSSGDFVPCDVVVGCIGFERSSFWVCTWPPFLDSKACARPSELNEASTQQKVPNPGTRNYSLDKGSSLAGQGFLCEKLTGRSQASPELELRSLTSGLLPIPSQNFTEKGQYFRGLTLVHGFNPKQRSSSSSKGLPTQQSSLPRFRTRFAPPTTWTRT